MITRPFLWLAVSLLAIATTGIDAQTMQVWTKTHLNSEFWAEGADVGDFNHDGKTDVVSGPYWYEGPSFLQRHQFSPATHTFKLKKNDGSEHLCPGFEGALGVNNAYSDNFLAYARDFNADGWPDVLVIGFPGAETLWYENPRSTSNNWSRHIVLDVTDNESPAVLDLTGDGRPELVCSSKGAYGWAEADWSNPTKPWTWHAVSPNNNYHKFTHGLGVGDINGDGRMDLLEKDGWWEQPASLAGYPFWKFHPFNFGTGGAQMYAYDVNGDGLNDVITSLAAHGFGLVWFEQYREQREIKFRQHLIMGEKPSENKYGIRFSQLHAMDLVDMNGDGLKDIVTGKRFWAHGPNGDPEPRAIPVLYWFKLVRGADGSVDFIPNLIDADSGVGTQVTAKDVNGDKLPDVVVGNKNGVVVLIQEKRKVSPSEFERLQPKPLAAAVSR